MLSNLSKLIGLFYLLLAFQCTIDRDFEPENLPDVLHIIGSVDPRLGVDVLVTKAVSTADTVLLNSLYINQADVWLADERGIRTRIQRVSNQGRYQVKPDGLEIAVGKKYRIEVSAPNLPSAISDWVTMPDTVAVDSLHFALDGNMNGSAPVASGYMAIQDLNRAASGHYIAKLFGKYAHNAFWVPHSFLNIQSYQPCTTWSGLVSQTFNSTCFQEGKGRFSISADAATYSPAEKKEIPFSAFLFRFGKTSIEFYEYVKVLEQPEEWDNAFINPQPSYTNIKGGWGVFYATNTVERRVAL